MDNSKLITAFFILILAFPTAFTLFKMLMLFVVILVDFYYKYKGKFIVDSRYIENGALLTFFLFFFLTLSVFNGVVNDFRLTDGTFFKWHFNILIFYFFSIVNITNLGGVIITIVTYSTRIAVWLLILYSISIFVPGLEEWIYSIVGRNYFGGITVNLESSSIMIRGASNATLMLLTPLYIGLLANNVFRVNKFEILTYIALVLVILASGRRGLQIILFFSVFVFHFLPFLSFKSIKKNIKLAVTIVVSIATIVIIPVEIFHSIANTFMSGFDPDGRSAGVRLHQLGEFLTLIQEKPLFGHGLNAYIVDYIRNTDQPYTYELEYVALVYQVGILGSLFLGCLVIYFLLRLRNRAKVDPLSKVLYPSSFMFLIISGTNPMLFTPWAFGFGGLILRYINSSTMIPSQSILVNEQPKPY
jgi:hypothetical protein